MDDDSPTHERFATPVLCDVTNIRCSNLFHLLVPGGKWHTEMRQPMASASSCNATFHKRMREPLLPPASAITSSSLALGYTREPICCHQRRSDSEANGAVS